MRTGQRVAAAPLLVLPFLVAGCGAAPDAELGLPEDETTLGDMMREAGYATGLVGKWHLGFREKYYPLKRGFDENLTDVFADRAVSFIERHAGEPFFLMLAPNAPHTPIQATSKYVDRYAHIEEEGARIYAAMVSSVDDMVGRVTATLREHGLEENTLVVFISDNGCIDYMPAVICTNSPHSGGKRYHLDGGIRVPYLRGEIEEPPHEYLFWRSLPNAAVRSGKWKLWRVDLTDQDPASVLSRGGRRRSQPGRRNSPSRCGSASGRRWPSCTVRRSSSTSEGGRSYHPPPHERTDHARHRNP